MSQKTCLRETLYSLVGWGIGEDELRVQSSGFHVGPGDFFICAPFDSVSSAGLSSDVSELSGMSCYLASRWHWEIPPENIW